MKTRSIATLVAAVALAACGDGNSPVQLQLTEAQAADMMDALTATGTIETGADVAVGAAATARVMAAAITRTIDATAPCPNGGTAGVQGSTTVNDDFTQVTAQVTQTFSACKSASKSGNQWTFTGAPSITTSLSLTSNPAAGTFTLTGSQTGALDVIGPEGSGRCVINVTLTATGDENAETFSATLSGSICGVTITQTVTVD